MNTKRKVCVVITARPSYSRIKTALRGDPAASRPRAAARRRRLGAARPLRQRGRSHRGGRLRDRGARLHGARGREPRRRWPRRPASGCSSWRPCSTTCSPTSSSRSPTATRRSRPPSPPSYMNIPVAHVQGGEVTGSIDEKVRHAVTKLADLHFVSTEQGAAERVIRMGEDPDDGLRHRLPVDRPRRRGARQTRRSTSIRSRSTAASGSRSISPSGYMVVMQHPVTTEYEQARAHVTETLHAVARRWACRRCGSGRTSTPAPTAPRTASARSASASSPTNIHFFKNMAPTDFLRLLYNSRVPRRQLERRHPRVLVPRRAGRQHRLAPGGPRARQQRHRRRLRPRRDRARRWPAALSNGRYPRDPLYGDGNAGERIAGRAAPRRRCGSRRCCRY